MDKFRSALVALAISVGGTCAMCSTHMNAMQRIDLEPVQGSMAVKMRSPVLPGGAMVLVVPETIGDEQEVLLNFPGYEPYWTGPDTAGAVGYTLANENVRYEVRIVPFCDHVDVWQGVRNLTARTWRHAFSFACVNPGPINDKTFDRTYIATANGPARIADISRTTSSRPLQFYELTGKQYQSHAFVDGFNATCQTPAADSWVATVAPDGRRVVGVAANDAAFLFNNGEYGCIHACPDFGDVPPGETRWALMRVYAMPGGLDDFIGRQARDRQGLVPSLRAVQRDPTKLTYQAAEIWLPWADAGHLTLRLPETLASGLGLLFIDHARADMPPVVRVDSLPDWQCDCATGALWYTLELPNDVAFGGQITPVANGAEMLFWVANQTSAALKGLSPQFCLMANGAPPFKARHLARTYLRTGGNWRALARTTHEVMDPNLAPWVIAGVGEDGPRAGASWPGGWYVCHERAEAPLLATADAAGVRVIAIMWENGRSVMSNGRIPCLHADPAIPDAEPGDTVHAHGRVYALSGGLDQLWTAYSTR